MDTGGEQPRPASRRRHRGPRFSAGGVLGRGFSIWFSNLIPFALIATFVYSPLLIYTATLTTQALESRSVRNWDMLTEWGGRVLQFITAGAVVFGVFQQLRGKRADMAGCIANGIRRLLPVIVVGILATIVFMLPFVAAGLIAIAAGTVTGAILILVAAIPAMMLACALYVAVPAAVVERPGIVGALKRSTELTKGGRWGIFGVLFVTTLLGGVVIYITRMAVMGDYPEESDVKLFMWLKVGISILLGALGAVMQAVAYHDLRVAKEGVGIEELAKVFD